MMTVDWCSVTCGICLEVLLGPFTGRLARLIPLHRTSTSITPTFCGLGHTLVTRNTSDLVMQQHLQTGLLNLLSIKLACFSVAMLSAGAFSFRCNTKWIRMPCTMLIAFRRTLGIDLMLISLSDLSDPDPCMSLYKLIICVDYHNDNYVQMLAIYLICMVAYHDKCHRVCTSCVRLACNIRPAL